MVGEDLDPTVGNYAKLEPVRETKMFPLQEG